MNAVIDAIKHLIEKSISADIKKAGMFSVQLETTHDITGKDQCSVILKYVTDAVHESLFAVVQCSTTTGQSFVTNIHGQYRGFSALRKVFGNCGRPHGGLYVEVVSTLSAIMSLKTLTKPEDIKTAYSDISLDM